MSSNILTYESLRSMVKGALDREDARVDKHLDMMIAMAQRIICSTYQLQDFWVSVDGACLPGINSIPKDVGWLQNYSLRISYNEEGQTTFPNFKILRLRTQSYLNAAYNTLGLLGRPESYSDLGQTAIVLGPTPDQAYPYKYQFYRLPPLLSSDVSTNIITERNPHTLFSKTTEIANLFLQNYQEGQSWGQWSAENFKFIKGLDNRLGIDMAETPDHTT